MRYPCTPSRWRAETPSPGPGSRGPLASGRGGPAGARSAPAGRGASAQHAPAKSDCTQYQRPRYHADNHCNQGRRQSSQQRTGNRHSAQMLNQGLHHLRQLVKTMHENTTPDHKHRQRADEAQCFHQPGRKIQKALTKPSLKYQECALTLTPR